MKITLINPPFTYFPNIRATKFNYCRPPLGICYLAAYLRKHDPEPHTIRVIDTLVRNLDMDQWLEEIAAGAPDIVGFTAVTPTANVSSRMAAELRKKLPGAVFLAGGPHATVRPQDLLDSFDAAVAGEGEATFLEIVGALRRGEPIEGIQGTAVRRNGETVRAPRRPLIEPLDTIPPPARDLLDLPSYYHSFPYNQKGGMFTTMFTARGCPRDCYFCANKTLWNGNLRYHSIDYVKNELDLLVNKQNMTLIFVDDDDFLSNKKRSREICENIVAARHGIKWICHCCVSSIDRESVRAMKRAGCVEIQIGVESGDERVLKDIPKSPAPERIRQAFALLKEERMNTWATFILGHPADTKDTIQNTIKFARLIDPTYSSFIVLLPFPGSRAFDTYLSGGMIKTQNWDDYTWHGEPVFETPALSAGDLVRLRARAMRAFYLRPRKLASYALQMIRAGSSKELFRNFLSWLSLVRPKKRSNG